MIINGFVKSQDLSLSVPMVVSDTISYLQFRFYFRTEEWVGMTKWAHFAQGCTVYDIPLQDDEIPAGELSLPAGPWKIYVHGTKYENGEATQRITTDEVTFMVKKTGCGCDGPLPIPQLSVGERLEARIAALEQGGGGGGSAGQDGVTFVPHVSADKVLSWTNNGDLENPEPVDLKTEPVILYASFDKFPSLAEALPGVIYYDTEKEDGYILNKQKTGWVRIIHQVQTVSLEDIPEEELDTTIVTAAMLKEAVQQNNDYGEI